MIAIEKRKKSKAFPSHFTDHTPNDFTETSTVFQDI